jgi:undecaprenyl-diphosphatase
VSRLGDGPVWVALGLVIAVMDAPRGIAVAAHIGIAALVGGALYRWIKTRTLRPRPYVRYRRIHALVPPLDEFSFPSGHTLHAVSITTIVLQHYPLLGWLLVPFTVLVAISRVALGLHYPSDVLAAVGIGLVLGFAPVARLVVG